VRARRLNTGSVYLWMYEKARIQIEILATYKGDAQTGRSYTRTACIFEVYDTPEEKKIWYAYLPFPLDLAFPTGLREVRSAISFTR
jgi:hypothetical protein